VKTWAPYNTIKFYTFDFELERINEIHEIPIEENKLADVVGIQLTRISENTQTYALLVDYCSFKEIFTIRFTRSNERPTKVKTHHIYDYKACLIGKHDLICPSLVDSKTENHFFVNQQVKMVPQYRG
jgi:hypothetical protein